MSHEPPLVTIFGAGVAGLSAAHELIERGFAVQVVEAAEDPDEEYACQVGGLAANQLARIPGDARRLHPYLHDEDRGVESTEDPEKRSVIIEVKAAAAGSITLEIDDVQKPVTTAVGDTETAIAALIVTTAKTFPGVDATSIGPLARIFALDDTRVPRVRATSTQVTLAVEERSALIELRATHLLPVESRFALRERLQLDRLATPANWKTLTDARGVSNAEKLDALWTRIVQAYQSHRLGLAQRLAHVEMSADRLSERMHDREELAIEIRAHTDDGGNGADDRALSLVWAEWVRAELVARNTGTPPPIPNLDRRLILVALGQLDPLGHPRRDDGRQRNNRVELRIVENLIPGEHGYRFFPRFYRHLFDTMKRTPVLDPLGRESGETAFDQLVPTEVVDLALDVQREKAAATLLPSEAIALQGRKPRTPLAILVRRPRSLEELRKLLRIHLAQADERGLGLEPRDLLRFQLAVAKFLTSSRLRREGYETESWMRFLGGERPAQAYSRRMHEILRETPQALLAMRADETDARSQGVIYSQLLMDALGDGSETNRTLNGPTTTAWLRHWKRYLKRQGVRFFCGRLEALAWQSDGADWELVPVVTLSSGEGHELSILLRAPGTAQISIGGVVVTANGADLLTLAQNLATQAGTLASVVATAGVVFPPTPTVTPLYGVVRLQSKARLLSVRALSPNAAVLGARPDQLGEGFVSQPLTPKSAFATRRVDFYLLAIPYPEASRLIWGAWNNKPTGAVLDGCLDELRKFDVGVKFTDGSGNRLDAKRDAYGRPHALYPLRDLSGVQFYSEHQTRVGRGHSYFPDAPWGLSSISQLAYWKERMGPDSAFLGQLSVDVGAWYTPHRDSDRRPRPSAWRSTKDKIAERVWDQMKLGLEPQLAAKLVTPEWHHVDQGIRFELEGRYAFGTRAVLEALGQPIGSFALAIDGGSTLSDPALAGLEALVQGALPCVARVWQAPGKPDRLVIGALGSDRPIGSQGARVWIAVRRADSSTRYHVRVNGGTVRTHAATAADTTDTIRDALVAAINANEVGVTAVAEAGPGEFTVRSGNPLVVGVLALDPAGTSLTEYLIVDPPRPFELSKLSRLAVFDGASVIENATPFLINNPPAAPSDGSIWRTRPGILSPLPNEFQSDQLETYRIFYRPTRKRWLMAGNQMATYTRLSTMESSNESARHAVTSILHALMNEPKGGAYNSAGHLLGAMPDIFDPEDYELDDAEPLKRLDAALAAAGRPHIFDMLDLAQRIAELPEDLAITPPGEDDVRAALKQAGKTLGESWGFTPLGEIEQTLRQALEALYGFEHD